MKYKNFLLHSATNEDTNKIKTIVFTVLKEYGLNPDENGKDKDLDDVEKNYIIPNGFFGIAIDTDLNEAIGTFGIFPIDNEICELRKMYILKSARGKGLGKFILQAAIEIATQKNYKKIVLETISPLKEAISLYTKTGFKEVPPHEISDRVDRAFELVLTQNIDMKTDIKLSKEILKAWHDDPSNWKWGVFYFNKQDKRLFPPKRIPVLGWTVNFANPFSILALVVIIFIIIFLGKLL